MEWVLEEGNHDYLLLSHLQFQKDNCGVFFWVLPSVSSKLIKLKSYNYQHFLTYKK